MSPFEEGREKAYIRGDSQFFNPYDQLDGQYEDWRNGWLKQKSLEQRNSKQPARQTASDNWSPFD